MYEKPCVLAIDQGTTSSRAIAFDSQANIIAVAQQEFPQIYPNSGWVEHDPEIIWRSSLTAARQAFADAEAKGFHVVSIGVTNQRETSIVWDRQSGQPLYNAIVWQDRRTSEFCAQLKRDNVETELQQKTGLLIDPYFSASKIAWILDQVGGARQQAEAGKLAFGTVDCFLINRFTDGAVHATDATNACRTSLYNIHRGEWDKDMLKLFNVPAAVLPKVLNSSDDFGMTAPEIFGRNIPIYGVAGDQQAASIGQCCFDTGTIKSTYGTGCFVLMNTGQQPVISKNRLLTTVAYQLNGETTYAIEGSIFVAGAAIQWLRDGLGVIASAKDSQSMASGLSDNSGVYLVPAFAGLGAPWWEPDARGAIFGITRATGPDEFVRAALESVCYQTADLFTAMAEDGITPTSLRVDGGMVANDWLLQFLANVMDMNVERPAILETTALGAAYLSGMKAGIYGNFEQLATNWRRDAEFKSSMTAEARAHLLTGWRDAVGRVIQK